MSLGCVKVGLCMVILVGICDFRKFSFDLISGGRCKDFAAKTSNSRPRKLRERWYRIGIWSILRIFRFLFVMFVLYRFGSICFLSFDLLIRLSSIHHLLSRLHSSGHCLYKPSARKPWLTVYRAPALIFLFVRFQRSAGE